MERAATFILGGAALGLAALYYLARKSAPDTTDSIGDSAPANLYTLGEFGFLGSISEAAGDIVTSVKSGVRGIRNNNPGNIDRTKDRWVGMSPDQSGDPRFVVFTEMRYGVRAMVVLLRNYDKLYGLGTIRQIITKWAPSRENNTAAYIAAVSQAVGVNADNDLDLYDSETMFRLVRAIISHENGRVAALLVSDTAVRDGIEAAS